MRVELLTTLAIPILVSMLMFSYAGFCWMKQKVHVHVRGKGWRSKEESPKTFYFTASILIFFGIIQLFSSIYFARF